jgi:hypothetical protein
LSDKQPKPFEEMNVAIKFKSNLTVDPNGQFTISSVEMFEIKGSENSQSDKPQNFMWDKHEVVA